jgi:diamine N-acetyltransferase
MKRNIAPFGNDIVRLRLIEEADLETTLLWRNRDEVRVWFKTSMPLTWEQHYGWFQRYLSKDDDFLFVIEVAGKLVGQASVYGIDWATGRAEVGRFLAATECGGKGYIDQACAELILICADTLALEYIFLEVLENNTRAVRLYMHNGFVEEQRYDGLIRMGRTVASLKLGAS